MIGALLGLDAIMSACGGRPEEKPVQIAVGTPTPPGIEAAVTASYEQGLMDGMDILTRTPSYSRTRNPPPGSESSELASYKAGLRDGINNTIIVELYYGGNEETHTHVFLRVAALNDAYSVQVKTIRVGNGRDSPIIESESLFTIDGKVAMLGDDNEWFNGMLELSGISLKELKPSIADTTFSTIVSDIVSGNYNVRKVNGTFEKPFLNAYR